MTLSCPACGEAISAEGLSAGERIVCPSCGKALKARASGSDSAPEHEGAGKGPSGEHASAPSANVGTKSCPYCAETIKAAAIKCRYCGSDLTVPPPVRAMPAPQGGPPRGTGAEETLYSGHPSPWLNFNKYIVSLLIAAAGIGIGFVQGVPAWVGAVIVGVGVLIALWFHIDLLCINYRITTERIEIEKGFVAKRVDNLDLFRAKDITLSVGVLDRFVGIGDVVVVSSDATDEVLTLQGLPGARRIYDRLKQELTRADRGRGVVHIET